MVSTIFEYECLHAKPSCHLLCDMRRIQLRKYLYLLLYVLYFVLRTLEVDDLDGNSLPGSLIISNRQ